MYLVLNWAFVAPIGKRFQINPLLLFRNQNSERSQTLRAVEFDRGDSPSLEAPERDARQLLIKPVFVQ